MRRIGSATLVAALLTAAVGCAAVEESSSAPPSGRPTPPPSASTLAPGAAVSVRVVVSGGITGAADVYEVRRGEPAHGLTADQVRRVLRLASTEAVRSLDGARQAGPQPCCDIQQFDVTVVHADGSRTRVRVPQTEPMPPELRRLVDLATGSR